MVKITFIGAGSTAFVKAVIGDVLLCDSLKKCEIALYDIDGERLEESLQLLTALNHKYNDDNAVIKTYLGVENRRAALKDSTFIVNAIHVGGYQPCTMIDFEIPKKYGLRQTIGDTVGIGGVFRGLRTISVLREIAEDVEAVCPKALFMNYTNPMAIISGYLERYTNMNAVGLCHSVQVCSERLLGKLGMDKENFIDKIAGINHMAWLLEITDKDGNDLYPEIRRLAKEMNKEKHIDMVRFDYIDKLGYYCTESSFHNAEYSPFYIKSRYPELIDKFQIPLDEYPKRCVNQINDWKKQKEELFNGGDVEHTRSNEYASRIMEAVVANKPYKFNGNVINKGLITNLPQNACVEVPCLVDANGVQPTIVGDLPPVLAAMNSTNIQPQLLTIEAAVTRKREAVYHAAMLDPHTAAELSIDDIIAMCDELIEAHTNAGYTII